MRCRAIVAALLWLAGVSRCARAAESARESHRGAEHHSGLIRNLPEIRPTPLDQVSVVQEFNFYSQAGVSNSTVDYGLPEGWNVGASFLNAQFFGSGPFAQPFQPDVTLNLEKHLPLPGATGLLVMGAQTGAAVLPRGAALINYSYVDVLWPGLAGSLDLDVGAYYGNAVLAGADTFGWHLNVSIPVTRALRFSADYLSGKGSLGNATLRLLWPLPADWQLGLGVQLPTPHSGNDYSALLGVYWH